MWVSRMQISIELSESGVDELYRLLEVFSNSRKPGSGDKGMVAYFYLYGLAIDAGLENRGESEVIQFTERFPSFQHLKTEWGHPVDAEQVIQALEQVGEVDQEIKVAVRRDIKLLNKYSKE